MSEQQATQGAFATLVQSALDGAVTPDRVRTKVEEHVENLVDETIADAMLSWSKTGQSIKEVVTSSLRVGDRLNIPSYGHVVCQILERQIQARVADVVAARLQKDMDDLLKLAPKRVKLSELIAELLGDANDDPCGCDGPSSIYMRLEWGEYSSCWLHIHKEGEPKSKWDSDIRVLISLPKKADDYEFGETPEGTICSGQVKGSDLKKDIRFGWGTEHKRQPTEFGRWFGFEQKWLAMYAVGTIIELDEDNCVLNKWDY